ncbi:hypothetical protein [Ferrovibrio sp.]|uniref:hypothetical protein n=1 Tax=Ferrovibrio sp. TaxID=1917215 RepID=UPI003D2CA653
MEQEQLVTQFLALNPQNKAAILTRMAHQVTIIARAETYTEDGSANGALRRDYNELLHRLVGHAARILEGAVCDEDDASFVMMVSALPYLAPFLLQFLSLHPMRQH